MVMKAMLTSTTASPPAVLVLDGVECSFAQCAAEQKCLEGEVGLRFAPLGLLGPFAWVPWHLRLPLLVGVKRASLCLGLGPAAWSLAKGDSGAAGFTWVDISPP